MNAEKKRLRSSSNSSDESSATSPRPLSRASVASSTARKVLFMSLSLKERLSSPSLHHNDAEFVAVPGCPSSLTGETSTPLCNNVLERVEAMDMSDEEAEEMLKEAPCHVQRWVRLQGCPTPDPLTHSCADVRPSLWGATATFKPKVKRETDDGSELDSEYDDELDVFEPASVDGTGRDIPDDDVLEEIRDIIATLENAMDDEADRLPGVSASYDWREDFDSFRGKPEHFSGPTPGPVKDYDTPYDAFVDIWSDDIMQRITQATNRYAKQTLGSIKAAGTMTPGSRLLRWTDTDADEMFVLFAVIMYMGIDPRTSQAEYWKTNDYLEIPKFRQLMSYNRYILLNKFLHFEDNSDASQDSLQSGGISARLVKIAPVVSHLNEKFSSLYQLQRELSIDESLTLYKGRLFWAQAIREKAARFGIKSFELCESQTGYLYRFQIYTGKESDVSPDDVARSVDLGSKSTKIVLDLLKGLENLGHRLTMYNFYNCPALARYLKSTSPIASNVSRSIT